MSLSLRSKFLVPAIIAVVLGTCVLTMVSYYKSSVAIQESCQEQLSLILKSTQNNIDSSVEYFKLMITDWKADKLLVAAAQCSLEDQTAKEACVRLTAITKVFSFIERINLFNKQGLVNSGTDPATVGKLNVADRTYFKEGISGKLNVAEIVIGKTTGKPVTMISAPVKDGDRIVGVLTAVLYMESFGKNYIESVKIGKQGYAFMYGPDGLMLSHPDTSLNYKFNLNESDYGRKMLASKKGILFYKDKDVERVTVYGPLNDLGATVAVTADVDEILAPIKSVRYINVIVSLMIVLLIGAVIYIVSSLVAGSIGKRVIGLKSAADLVGSGSKQLASVSGLLAEGASEQAASIEETSSSLEEMSSMTKHNASNANQANQLMAGTKEKVSQAGRSMSDLTACMGEISRASEETSKIIKTIDEIAFQTNLLALNAAVEAARAGEAGAGFAVVADEVRNLAMRAAEAAKNTAGLIDGTVGKIAQGADLVDKTGKEFNEVADSVAKSGGLIGEISAACLEQAQGIEQISRAVSEMDKVVQQNSANAEELATTAEEMSSQSHQMNGFVAELKDLVAGSKA